MNWLVCSRSQSAPAALMWAMNSSVTVDSETSVTSSLCREISCSSRSNGPSKLSRCTRKMVSPGSCPEPVDGLTAGSVEGPRCCASTSSARVSGSSAGDRSGMVRTTTLRQPPDQLGLLALGLEVGQERRDGHPDDAPAVHRDAVPGPQLEPGPL